MMFLFFSDENTNFFLKSHESKHIQQPMQEKPQEQTLNWMKECFVYYCYLMSTTQF